MIGKRREKEGTNDPSGGIKVERAGGTAGLQGRTMSSVSILNVRCPQVSRWSCGERLTLDMLIWELSSKR